MRSNCLLDMHNLHLINTFYCITSRMYIVVFGVSYPYIKLRLFSFRSKLRHMLQMSSLYRVQLILGKAKETNMHAECAILYGKVTFVELRWDHRSMNQDTFMLRNVFHQSCNIMCSLLENLFVAMYVQ